MIIVKQRKQIRLKKYDYSDAGWYFVTICTKDRQEYFGNIIDNKMNLNECGNIVKRYWLEIPEHFNNVELDEFQIMSNHIHGIVIIRNSNKYVGAGFPRPFWSSRPILGQIIGYFKYQTTKLINNCIMKGSDDPINIGSGNPTPTEKRVKLKQIFQRSFYDHIIRNEYSLNRIRQYIKNNLRNWEEDRNNLYNQQPNRN